MKRKNIFILGLDDFHLAQLATVRNAESYNFIPLFRYEEIRGVDRFPVREFLKEAAQRLSTFAGSIDAIIGYWDFPVSTMLPILRGRFGLRTPSLESVLKCEHKYWSRLEQAEIIPECVPAFAKVNPFADDPLAGVDVPYPFWLKPVKAVLSHLGFQIDDENDFRQCIDVIRQKISRFAEPFNYLLRFATLPDKVADVGGHYCIAESIISADRQCTLEGYVFEGEAHVYGVIDSIREGPLDSCFSRYHYPSRLPQNVLQRIKDLSLKVMLGIGYDNGPFNIEFFWDTQSDHIWLLEINPRISKSHCPLFHLVDGAYHHEINIDLALGNRPDFPHRRGRFNCAAKFMLRRYEDALVKRVPTEEEVRAIKAIWPDAIIQIPVRRGMRLSELRDQDSYSYEIAVLFLGAEDDQALEAKYRQCLDMLPFEWAT